MAEFVLIVIMSLGGKGFVQFQEFGSQESCDIARKVVADKSDGTKAYCVKK